MGILDALVQLPADGHPLWSVGALVIIKADAEAVAVATRECVI